MEYNNLQGFVDKDGNVITSAALKYITITDTGNIQITSPDGKKINIESGDNVAIKPVGKVQLDTNHFTDDSKKDEFEVSTICDKKTAVEGLKLNTAGIKIYTEGADVNRGWKTDIFSFVVKVTKTLWSKLNIKASAIDLRANATGPGTGGGIALQTASCDSDRHENKLKHETDRILDVESGLPATAADWSNYYNGTGGDGIEIGTENSQFLSKYMMEYRFKRGGRIYPVTRRRPVTDADGKTDYPTQADDSKDIKGTDYITWDELVRGILYLISKGYITRTTTTTDLVD